jgi:hypothetical protein
LPFAQKKGIPGNVFIIPSKVAADVLTKSYQACLMSPDAAADRTVTTICAACVPLTHGMFPAIGPAGSTSTSSAGTYCEELSDRKPRCASNGES